MPKKAEFGEIEQLMLPREFAESEINTQPLLAGTTITYFLFSCLGASKSTSSMLPAVYGESASTNRRVGVSLAAFHYRLPPA